MLSWMLSVVGAVAAVPFPAEDAWEPLVIGGAPIEDVLGDVENPEGSLDLLGTSTSSAAAWYADGETVFLRVQMGDDPEVINKTWGFLLDLDGDDLNFEYAVMVEGFSKDLQIVANSAHVDGTWVTTIFPVDVFGYGDLSGGETRVVQDGAKLYIDAQLSRADLLADLGLAGPTPVRIAAFSTEYWSFGLDDVAGCDGSNGPCEDLAAVLSDTVYVDLDDDGLGGPEETALGTVPDDADTDDDGLLDGLEGEDTDADGIVDALECDTDGDGLSDGTEAGVVLGTPDTDPGCFVADLDPLSTTDPAVADSDGGGLVDGGEDADHDGAIGPWETDPNDAGDDLDSDLDGVPDVFDDLFGDGPDVDSDGDGILDAVEGLGDTNGDDTPDFADDDSDGDGILDAIETADDADGDLVPDYVDLDSDDDGVPDSVETAIDTDGDLTLDFRDLDSDDDGIPDEDEGEADTDGDLTPDRIDTDSDSDGLLDLEEGGEDWDDDGTPDYRDLDSDDDGWPDSVEGSPEPDGDALDTDRDGDADFRDLDSDDDGIPDASEGDGDVDCDGKIDRLDDDPEDSFCDTGIAPPTVDTDGELPDPQGEGPDPFAAQGQFTGGSCSVAPRGAPWWAMAVVAVLWRRRQRLRWWVAAAPLVPSAAAAQSVDAERFAPSVDGGVLTTVEDGETGDAGAHGLGLLLDYADDPFVFRPDEGEEIPVLGAVATAHVTGWYSLGPLAVGTEIPVHLFTDGYRVDSPTHLGDIRLYGKVRVLHSGPVSAGPYLDLSLPTGAVAAWVGAGELVANGGVIVSAETDRLVASVNVGVQNGTGNTFGALQVSPAISWAAGLGVSATDRLSFAAEVDAEQWLSNPGLSGDAPIQGLLTVHQQLDAVRATLGAGTGLSRGIGAPDFRIVGGLSWSPSPKADGPSIAPAVADGGSSPTSPTSDPAALCRLVVRTIDPAGRPIGGAEVRVVGTIGEPLVTGADGMLEARLRPGDTEIAVTADGWSSATRTVTLSSVAIHDVTLVLAPSEVRIDRQANQIFLVDKVFFEVNRTELLVESLKALDALVAVLLSHPEILTVRIEGHTDATGEAAANLVLSKGRAESVRKYLVDQGIAPERLRAEGLGESRPLQVGDSEDVNATNRRVEFHIVSLAESTGD